MELRVFANEHILADSASDMIIAAVAKKPDALLCFATGDSPRLTYQLLAQKAERQHIDFSKCFFIGLDEWLDIEPGNSGTCHYFLHQYLLDPLGVQSSRVHLFDGLTKNEQQECDQMNQLIKNFGGIDFILVGVGMNGHIGFNEPGTAEDSTTHIATLDHTTRTVGQKYFDTPVPINKGITIGLKQIIEARSLVMLASGKRKAPVIRRLLEDDISTAFPGSLIRQHPAGILVIDEAAASELQKELYDPGIEKR